MSRYPLDRREHITALVNGPRSLNCFGLIGVLPIPWKSILSKHGQIFLGVHVSNMMLMTTAKHLCLAESHKWLIKCGCFDRASLQCLAAKVVMAKICYDFLAGSYFNEKWLWYRGAVNLCAPRVFMYAGSVMFQNVHYIYLHCMDMTKYEEVKACFNLDTTYFIMTNQGLFIILKCVSCKSESYITVACCARRVKRIIKRVIKTVWERKMSVCMSEQLCQHALTAAITYGKCYDMRNVSPFYSH